MALVLIESPNKVPTLRKILGKDYKIMPTVGHIMDLPKGKLGVDLDTFEAEYKVNPDKKDVVKKIKLEAKNHDVIYIATDADREGEAIGHHIASLLPKRGKTVHRIRFNEITKKAVLKAMKDPSSLDDNLYESQKARRITDRLFGFKLSQIMWGKGLKHASAGRVQSVALKYVADREKEIRAFIPEEYWKIKAEIDLGFDVDFYGKDKKEFVPRSETQAKKIKTALDKSNVLVVDEYTRKPRSRKPDPPFITSTLQQVASSKFGWPAKKTMEIAQNLFSSGQITYHRTDSTRVSEDKIVEIRGAIEKKYGKEYLSDKPRQYSAKKDAQDAHEAVRPTFIKSSTPTSPSEDKLLKLIKARFMASQMSNAEFEQTGAKFSSDTKPEYNFKVNGSVLKFDGFLKVYGDAQDDNILPELKEGQKVSIEDLKATQHFTQPPNRYSDASLIKLLEKEGVGRPSTYAAIVEKITSKKYVKREGKMLKATDVGIMVSDYLSTFFAPLVESGFTSNMESDLDKIAEGDKNLAEVLGIFYSSLKEQIKDARKGDPSEIFSTGEDCEGCGKGKMIRRLSEHGVFLGCSKWPECGYTINFDEDGNPVVKKVETGEACQECGGIMIERDGKYGKFLGCQNYSNGCRFTIQIDSEGNKVAKKSPKKTGKKCPKCKKGDLVERESSFGTFIACNKFPKCKHKEF